MHGVISNTLPNPGSTSYLVNTMMTNHAGGLANQLLWLHSIAFAVANEGSIAAADASSYTQHCPEVSDDKNC